MASFERLQINDLKHAGVTHPSFSTFYYKEFLFCSPCKWSLVHFPSPGTVVSYLFTNTHAFATKRHFNWELSHPSSPLGLVKNFICRLELISACPSPAGGLRVVWLNSSFWRNNVVPYLECASTSNFGFTLLKIWYNFLCPLKRKIQEQKKKKLKSLSNCDIFLRKHFLWLGF